MAGAHRRQTIQTPHLHANEEAKEKIKVNIFADDEDELISRC